MLLHNLGLVLFSSILMSKTLFIVYDSIKDWDDIYCANYSDIEFVVWLFYISKYYELLDSYFLVCSGKNISYLQMFHHAGVIFVMWYLCKVRIFGVWLFVVINSGVHGSMYSYFACHQMVTMSKEYYPRRVKQKHRECVAFSLTIMKACVTALKPCVTALQMIQFVFGLCAAYEYTFTSCYSASHARRANLLFMIYVILLLIFFSHFAKSTYFKRIT
jgi:hypothetical protein